MARETLPGADERERADGPDGEMEVIRERLDGPPVEGWRAPLAGGMERIGSWLGADSAQEPSPTPRAGGGWDRRLSARQKLTRGAAATLVIVLALFALLDGPNAARGALSRVGAVLFPPPPTPIISASDYSLNHLPPAAQHIARIALTPETTQPGAAFACWVNSFKDAPADQRGIAVVYQTDNYARTWRRLPLPTLNGQDCDVIADTTGSDGALVVVWPGYTSGGLCLAPRLFHSRDGGATWGAIPLAAPGVTAPCNIQFAVVGDAIFAWSTQPLISGPRPVNATGRLIVTRDQGATWRVADAGLADDAGLRMVGFRSGGRILATTPDVSGPAGVWKLVESADYGATWRDLGDLPGAFPMVYASTDPSVTSGGGWGRLYVVARTLTGDVPASPSQVLLATATIGADWKTIPLPPLAAGDTTDPEIVGTVVLGVGPAQSLLVEHGDAPTNDDEQLRPARRLWAWSADQRRWLLDPQPTPGNADLMGWGWSQGDQTIWVTSLQLGIPPTLRLFTKTYTVANLGPTR